MSGVGGVAFLPEHLRDVKKEFTGVIIRVDYGERPFGFTGRPDIAARKQLCIQIASEQYAKPQYEWYVPTYKKGTKWGYFIMALAETGAIRDVVIKGENDEERIRNFAESLIGMKFDWEEQQVEVLAGKKVECLIPVRYYGKVSKEDVEKLRQLYPVTSPEAVETVTVGEEEVKV